MQRSNVRGCEGFDGARRTGANKEGLWSEWGQGAAMVSKWSVSGIERIVGVPLVSISIAGTS
jgi:hypothetical protein